MTTDGSEADRNIWRDELADWLPTRLFDAHAHLFDRGCLRPGCNFPARNCYRKFGGAFTLEHYLAWAGEWLPGRELHGNSFGHPGIECDRDAAAVYSGAVAARELRGTHALRVGSAFAGMGDFAVAESVLRERFGIAVREIGIETLDAAVCGIDTDAVEAELAADRERYACDINEDAHRRSVQVGLGLRRLLDDGEHGAMSVNFQLFDGARRPAAIMPFLEISKAMARSVGYGGEGDVLTAALVGALARAFGTVTFSEIFCADWTGGTLFLSHMGEISPTVLAGKPRLFGKPFFVPGVPPPAVLTGPVQPGPAVYVNLSPGADDTFSLIVAPVEVLAEDDRLDPAMRDTVRAWIRPRRPVAEFLEAYSRAGGTHHSALVLGDTAEAIAAFGRQLGVGVVTID